MILSIPFKHAAVTELADVRDSKSREGNLMWVQLPPAAPERKRANCFARVLSAYPVELLHDSTGLTFFRNALFCKHYSTPRRGLCFLLSELSYAFRSPQLSFSTIFSGPGHQNFSASCLAHRSFSGSTGRLTRSLKHIFGLCRKPR